MIQNGVYDLTRKRYLLRVTLLNCKRMIKNCKTDEFALHIISIIVRTIEIYLLLIINLLNKFEKFH